MVSKKKYTFYFCYFTEKFPFLGDYFVLIEDGDIMSSFKIMEIEEVSGAKDVLELIKDVDIIDLDDDNVDEDAFIDRLKDLLSISSEFESYLLEKRLHLISDEILFKLFSEEQLSEHSAYCQNEANEINAIAKNIKSRIAKKA